MGANISTMIFPSGGVNFTGAAQLRGGDIDPTPTIGCDNDVVNFGDYAVLVSHWLESVSMIPAAAVADINGDGVINIFDYGILGSNWFTCGDPE